VVVVLWDFTDSLDMAPSFCFIAERSCCLAAFKEFMANSSVTMCITSDLPKSGTDK
jgi:hypothetical protein